MATSYGSKFVKVTSKVSDLWYNPPHMEQHATLGQETKVKAKGPKFVRWAVMLGIVIALNLFILVARTLVLTLPDQTLYCPAPTASNTPQTAQSCSDAGGIWNDLSDPSTPTTAAPTKATGYCDLSTKCMPQYEAAFTKYELYSFVIEIGLGVLAIVISVLPIGSAIVSAGLAYGGVLAFIIAGAQYWSEASSLLRLGMSVLALGTLIYIGIKRFHD
jgi:hypothetical protein